MEINQPQNKFEELLDYVRNLHHRINDFDKIKSLLAAKSHDEETNEQVLAYFKKEYYAHKRKEGLAKIGIGSVVILLGFLITCFNFHANESFNFAMYGLTSVGICIVFWGLYKIIG